MAKVDELVIELRAKTGQFDTAMDKAGKKTADFATIAGRAKIAWAAAGAALVTIGKNAVDAAGHMQDLSMESGIAASTLSALNSPLQQSGSSVDEFAASVVKMNRALSDAASGENKNLADVFLQLGLSVEKLRSQSPQEQLNAITIALGKIKDQGDLTRMGVEIFGRSFSGLIPIIKETKGNLNEYAVSAQNAGDALSDEQIARLDAFGDSFTRIGLAVSNAVGGGLADFLSFMDIAILRLEQFARTSKSLEFAGNLVSASASNTANFLLSDVKRMEERKIAEYKAKAAAAGFATEAQSGDVGINLQKEFTSSGLSVNPKSKIPPLSSGLKKSANEAEKLQDALDEISQTLSLELSTEGLSDVDRKTAELDARVAELTKKYGKLTDAQKLQVEVDKEKIARLDEVKQATEDARNFAQSMGNAFSSAFEDAALGADGFSGALEGLGRQIQSILFRQVIGNPLSELLQGKDGSGGILGSIFTPSGGGTSGGGSSIFSSLFDALPSFDVGTNRVPKDMIAKIHEDEIIVPAYDANKIRSGGGMGGGGVQINVINNSSAKVTSSSSQNSSGGMDIKLMIDEAVANNISTRGSKTNQAMSSFNNQALVRR